MLRSWASSPAGSANLILPAHLKLPGLLHVPPRDIVYLGDTATDMQTAIAAGMMPVGALWGFRPAAELLESGARHLIETPSGLMDVLG